MIVAIDGPAGSGKSTVAREVARRLGFQYLDTGAMYRAVTLLGIEAGLSPDSERELSVLALDMDFRSEEKPDGSVRFYLGDRDVSEAIRTPLVSRLVSPVSALPGVRHALTVKQRQIAERGNTVLEGRDIGTVVCPGAQVKIYLTADPEERARRRRAQMQEEQGLSLDLKSVERELLLRDTRDSGRAVAPLRKAKGAVTVDTTNMTIDEVVDFICAYAGMMPSGKTGVDREGPAEADPEDRRA